MKSRIKWFLICVLCMVFACSAAHALTYEEAISQASTSGVPADFVVSKPVPLERLIPGTEMDGLSATWTYENNLLTITVDTEKTDWVSVIAKNYFPGAGDVYIMPGVESPSGESTMHISTGFSVGGGNTEKALLELMQRDYEERGPNSAYRSFFGWSLGRYDEESGLFQPAEKDRHGGLCIWGEDGSLQAEHLIFSIRYTSTEPLTVKTPKVAADDIYVLYDLSEDERKNVSATVKSGSVHVEADVMPAVGTIAVAVPEEAGNENWWCNLSGSWINGSCRIIEPEESGLDRRVLELFSVDFSKEGTHDGNATLEWMDENGQSRGYSYIGFTSVVGQPKPWPYYVADWQPVPTSRLTLDKNFFPSGVDAVYDGNGLLTLTIDHDALPESANFGQANYELFVSPPDPGCTIRGMNQSSSSGIFGAEMADVEKVSQLNNARDKARSYEAGNEAMFNRIFETYHQQGSDVTVYMTSEMTGLFAGRILLISWWEDGKDPAVDDPYLTEYIVVRQESCVRVFTSTPYESEDDLPSVITQPVIVIPQGSLSNPNNSMEFTAMIYPQNGNKARYYKLELVDEYGNPVDLEKGQYKVFLPFPEGISEEEKQNLELIHMTDAHVEIENMSINGGNLHLTDAGIWFQAKSFSPFMLKWGEEGQAEYPVCQCENGHDMQYALGFGGAGFVQFCECHEAFVEFIGPAQDEYAFGDYIELIISWSWESWWQGDEPMSYYASITDDGYGEWSTEMPWESGEYAVKMMYGTLETCEYTFTIAEKVTECENGHTLQYSLSEDGNGLWEVCTGENCHVAFAELTGLTKDVYEVDEEIGLNLRYEGTWLGVQPKAWYRETSSDEWDFWMPWDAGEYVVHLECETFITNDYTFTIRGEDIAEPECGNGNSLSYEFVARQNGETNGIRQFCPDGCHDVNITFFAPFDIVEGGELDYVCSWDGEWLGEEYPELEFAMNVGGEYVGWSTELPTAAGDYAMRMSFGEWITDYQTFSIFPAEEEVSAELILPASLTKVDTEAFAGTDVVYVVCPDGMTEIGSRAFADCASLAVIEIPASVEIIAQDAFEGCGGFTIVGETGSAAHQFAVDAGLTFEEK